MSEPNSSNKSKHKKKKSKSAKKIEDTSSILTENNCPIQLPQNVNECTFYKEVQVTMMETKEPPPAAPPPPPVPEKSGKKNKKKSKSQPKDEKSIGKGKNVSEKTTQPPVRKEALVENKPQPLTESRDGMVKLSSLPEITILPMVQKKSSVESVPEEQVVNDTSEESSLKKKKRRKKKKKGGEEKIDENKDVTTTEAAECPSALPTYVKLPATGDATVLVVSHKETPKNNADQASSIASIISGSLTHNNLSQMDSVKQLPPKEGLVSSFANSGFSLTPLEAAQPCNHAVGDTEDKKNVTGPSVSKPLDKASKNIVNLKKNEKQSAQEVQKSLKQSKKSAEQSKEKVVSETATKGKQQQTVTKSIAKKVTQASLFAHLPQYRSLSAVSKYLESKLDIHPAILAVGAQCAEGIISGSNARCVALLSALKQVIDDYKTPPNKELSRDLDAKFQECINFIAKCRPLAVSMTNAVRVIKYHVNNISSNISDAEAKKIINSQIDKFVNEEICLARKAICANTINKIADGDVILTYAFSSVVKEALVEAHKNDISFRVIVVDSRPKMEAKHMLKCLLEAGVDCSYMLINGISYVMREVTKVIIGAHALQANGYVMSRVGSSQIALSASFYNIPFLVCCETYKFCERVHTDSFVYNELGDPESFLDISETDYDGLNSWKEKDNLHLLNPLYDIMPPHLVSMVITEKGMLPCTSVPVVLRVRHSGTHEQ